MIVTFTPIFTLNPMLFQKTAESIFCNQKSEDIWVLCIDQNSKVSVDELNRLISFLPNSLNYKILRSNYGGGAGNTRNFALTWFWSVYEVISDSSDIILTFLDADDSYYPNFFNALRDHYNHSRGVVTYSYIRRSNDKLVLVEQPEAYVDYRKFLRNYCTSCLTTAVLIDDINSCKSLKFGSTLRANDQLFFLDAVRKFGGVHCKSSVQGIYNIGHATTISSNKLKMPMYKYMALRKHGLTVTESLFYMVFYALKGVKTQLRDKLSHLKT